MSRRMKLNTKDIAKKVSKSKKFNRASEQNARRKFEIEIKKLLADFDTDPVTQELRNKASASNISGTLMGLNTNLFHYIGFYASDNPEEELRNYLRSSIILSKKGTVNVVGRKPRVEYRVTIPSNEAIKSVTKMPWSSKSWAFGVETGIDGFNYFLNLKSRKSRSGKGVQSKFVIREGGFRPRAYITTMLQRFISRFGK